MTNLPVVVQVFISIISIFVASNIVNGKVFEFVPSNIVCVKGRCRVCDPKKPRVKCKRGHVVCLRCIEIEICLDIFGQSSIPCPVNDCSSDPFTKEDFRGRISTKVYSHHEQTSKFMNRVLEGVDENQKATEKCDQDIQLGNQRNEELLNKRFSTINKQLSSSAAQSQGQCPHLICMYQIDDPTIGWKKKALKTFEVVFVCAKSYKKGHEPFKIKVAKDGIKKFVPWLDLSYKFLQSVAQVKGATLPNLDYLQNLKKMEKCMKSLESTGHEESETNHMVMEFRDGAHLQLFATLPEIKKHVDIWKEKMTQTMNSDGKLIWVLNEEVLR
jgi:hypothetical protein